MVNERIKYLEDEINRLCEMGEFSDELLEYMSELEELQHNPGSYQPETGDEDLVDDLGDDLDEGISESREGVDALERLVNEFNVRVVNNKQDYIRLDYIYSRGNELGLTKDDIHHAITLIIKHAQSRYKCYVLPKGGFRGYDITKDVWENLQGDIIVFDNRPLVFHLTDWEGELPVDLLTSWGKIGFKFVVGQ